MNRALFLACVALPALAQASEVRRVDHGVIVVPDSGTAREVRVIAYGPDRFRVTALPDAATKVADSLMVIAKPEGDPAVAISNTAVTLRLPGATAEISRADGRVQFRDAAGKPMLVEEARAAFVPTKVDGQPYVTIAQQYNRGTDEGLFGLGQHQNRQMNYNGEDVELAQHNMDIAVPFLVSTRGYGLLWDNNSITRFGNPQPYQHVGKGPVGEGLAVSSDGKPGWKADYYLGDKLAVSRREAFIDYQFIKDQANWPAAAKAQTVASPDSGQNTQGNVVQTQRVVWTGDIAADKAGIHKFRLYSSSYVKVFADGKQILARWRQNWNPWFHNFELPMQVGKPVSIRIEWEPNAGYLALYHSNPLPAPDRHSVWFSSDVGKAVDYYYVGGGSIDKAIAGYRALTGKSEMMPKWAYGFWQSRQRYETQDQLLSVVKEYRRREIPFDNIVQDWFYWPEDQWGSHTFDAKRFPQPKQMVDDVHALNAQIMISVWPKFYPNTDNAKELAAKGLLYRGNLEAGEKDWVGKGYANTDYDAYSPEARTIYFRQMREQLVDKGFDAWWMDATEPDIHSNLSIEQRAERMGPTAVGPGAALFNSYPLVHAQGVADGLRVARPDVRPFILTRSGFGGLQRTSSAVWSGDVAARWDDLRDQISAGINVSMAGIPNWTHDIGGFAVEDRYTNADPAHLAEWRELNLRWFQFGAFSPLFRSHGETPKREIFEIAKDDKPMYDAMVDLDRLRYRLMPYIYTVAADTWSHDGSIMRGLAMDFTADRKAWGVDDEYMFGPSLLVAPVTVFGARNREVYLPAGSSWIELSSGRVHAGGRSVSAAAPREQIPLFARAGAIIPTGPVLQYALEKVAAPTVIDVFPGADGAFTLYEDDGTSMAYRTGAASRIPLRWNDRSKQLTIGKREGSFAEMSQSRWFVLRVHRPYVPVVFGDATAGQPVLYKGEALTITASR